MACTGRKIIAYMILVGNPECKRPLGNSRFRRDDTIKNDFKERGWVGLDCFHLIRDRDKKRSLLKTLTNLLLFFFSFSFSSSSSSFCSSSTTVRCVTWLLIKCSSISSSLRQFMLISHSRYLQILLDLTSPSIPWSTTFPYSFHSDRKYCLWHSFLIKPINLSIPYHLNTSDSKNFTVSVLCIIYLLICSYSPTSFLFRGTIIFSYNLPFEYYKIIHFS